MGMSGGLERMSCAVKTLLDEIGEDVERDGLKKTPMRVAKALVEMTGLLCSHHSNFEIFCIMIR